MGFINRLLTFFNLKKSEVNPTKNSVSKQQSSTSSDAPLEFLDISENVLSELFRQEIYDGKIVINYKVVNTNARISVFPILRLPHLALKNCLRVMEPSELVDFSWCSKATRNLVKTIKIKPQTFLVEFDKNSGITLTFKEFPGMKWIFTANRNTGFEENEIIERRETDGYDVFSTRRTELEGPQVNYLLLTHWKDIEIGLEKWVEHFVYIFNSPITHFLFFYNYYLLGRSAEILDWFFNIQSILENVHFIAVSLNNDLAERMLNNLKISKYLRLEIETKKRFQYRNKNVFNTEELNVIRGQWITIENILDMTKCKTIQIWRSRISEKDLNIFLMSWINGNYPKLESILIFRDMKNRENVNERLILHGTNFERLDSDTLEMLEQDENIGIPLEMIDSGGHSIRNKKGLMGSCLMRRFQDFHVFILHVLKK